MSHAHQRSVKISSASNKPLEKILKLLSMSTRSLLLLLLFLNVLSFYIRLSCLIDRHLSLSQPSVFIILSVGAAFFPLSKCSFSPLYFFPLIFLFTFHSIHSSTLSSLHPSIIFFSLISSQYFSSIHPHIHPTTIHSSIPPTHPHFLFINPISIYPLFIPIIPPYLPLYLPRSLSPSLLRTQLAAAAAAAVPVFVR